MGQNISSIYSSAYNAAYDEFRKKTYQVEQPYSCLLYTSCSNGSAFAIAKSVYDALGAKTFVINCEPDGTNINTNCGSTHIEVLREYVKENHLDVGFAFDGDADRCIAVDENGNVIDGDLILYVCGKYMKENGRLNGDTIVTTIMSNLGLYKACDKVGLKYEKTAVGDKYVYENMVQNNFCLLYTSDKGS